MSSKCYVSAEDYRKHWGRSLRVVSVDHDTQTVTYEPKERRMNGEIMRIYPDKKFGFIKGQDKRDYFFHASSLKNYNFEDLQSGQEVQFEDSETSKGPRAEDVFVV